MSEHQPERPEATRVRFRPVSPDPVDLLDPAVTTLSPPEPPGPGAAAAGEPDRGAARSAGTAGTSSSTSEPRRPRPVDAQVVEAMATAVVGVLAFGMLGARLLLRRRGVEVRPMSPADKEAIAEPLGRIGARHVPLGLAPDWVKDFADLGETAGAFSNYLDGAARRPTSENKESQ